jgi:lysophospholipase L1-like esterase
MKRKLFFGFGFVFTGLVVMWTVNLVAALFLDAVEYHWITTANSKSKRASLVDQELAETIYREYRLLETRYVPYVAWSREAFSGEAITVNNAGDRVHPSTTDAPVGHVRFFGGSTIWGSGVNDENTLPAHFNALHPDHAVFNHGESGFVSRQSLARLIDLVTDAEPMDLVIFHDGCNDLYTLCREDVTLNGHREMAKITRRVEKSSAVAAGLYGSSLRVAREIADEIGFGDPEIRCHEPEYANRVARKLIDNWKIARRVAAMGGAELHAFLQPIATLGTPNLEYLPDDVTQGRRAACYKTVYPLVQEIIREEGEDWMHDLTDVMNVDEYIYIDGCHVNGRGNQIIAERMNSILGDQLARRDLGAPTGS